VGWNPARPDRPVVRQIDRRHEVRSRVGGIVEGNRGGYRAACREADDADPIPVDSVLLRMLAQIANGRNSIGRGKRDDGRDDVVQLASRHELPGWVIGLALNKAVFQHETSDAFGVEPAGDIESLAVD